MEERDQIQCKYIYQETNHSHKYVKADTVTGVRVCVCAFVWE